MYLFVPVSHFRKICSLICPFHKEMYYHLLTYIDKDRKKFDQNRNVI